MPDILLIEVSATLRHVLGKLLTASGHDVVTGTGYRDGRHALEKRLRSGGRFDALVMGWPVRSDADALQLYALLNEPNLKDLPLLALAHDEDPAARVWLSRRHKGAMLLWRQYLETPQVLSRLLSVAPPQAFQLPAQAETEPMRVLFVDDSATVRAKFQRLLSKHGYDVETASCVTEGMDKALHGSFDIAIIDYFMPDATGDTLCRELQSHASTAGMTTAIITATYRDNVIQNALRAGAVECMFKNESDALFLARIDAMSRSIRTHKSIENERKRLQGILGSVGDGVYGVNSEGLVTFLNPATMRVLGYENTEELIGQSAHSLFHHSTRDGTPVPLDACFLHQAYALGDQLYGWETVFWHRSGKPIPVECSVYPLRIESRLQGSVVAFRDISERKLLEEELKWRASHDSLTKLLNRDYFEAQLAQEVERLRRSDEQSALLYIDLDRFKYINDTAGHTAGDELLVRIGSKLLTRLRKSDLLARLGGDEFAIITRNIAQDSVYATAESFRKMLDNYTFTYNSKQYRVNGSIGVAMINKETHSPGEVLADADIACHIAKNKGRNNTHIFVPESDSKRSMDMDLGWSSRLHNAIENDQFVLHYQPILPVKTLTEGDIEAEQLTWSEVASRDNGQPVLYEVLVRLREDDDTLVYPHAFLPTAERFNMMYDIDVWIIRNALHTLAGLQEKGHDSVFNINLSGQTIVNGELTDIIKKLIQQLQIRPSSLIFEITETSAISNLETAKEFINELHAIGCRFALDDFGSGFCSFSHLKYLPVDMVKIDGLFSQGVAADGIDQAIVTSIHQISHSLGKQTVAEYVENAEILRFMYECGIDYVQGFYISKPFDSAGLITSTPVAAGQGRVTARSPVQSRSD